MPASLNTPQAFYYDEMIHEMADTYKLDPIYVSEKYTALDYTVMKCLQAAKNKRQNYADEQSIKRAKK